MLEASPLGDICAQDHQGGAEVQGGETPSLSHDQLLPLLFQAFSALLPTCFVPVTALQLAPRKPPEVGARSPKDVTRIYLGKVCLRDIQSLFFLVIPQWPISTPS